MVRQMIVINGKEINGYEDYQQLKGPDILAFMKEQSPADIAEFKAFAAEPKYTEYDDGTKVERKANFFELRNWVLDKYAPGIRAPKPNATKSLIDEIMDL